MADDLHSFGCNEVIKSGRPVVTSRDVNNGTGVAGKQRSAWDLCFDSLFVIR